MSLVNSSKIFLTLYKLKFLLTNNFIILLYATFVKLYNNFKYKNLRFSITFLFSLSSSTYIVSFFSSFLLQLLLSLKIL